MKKMLQNRKMVLTIGVIAILLFVYLAASLSSLEFKPATPLRIKNERPQDTPADIESVSSALAIYIAIASALFFLILIFTWLSPKQRKKFLWGLARILVILTIVVFLLYRFAQGEKIDLPQTGGEATPVTMPDLGEPEQEVENAPPAVFVPPETAPWTSYVATLVVLLAGIGLEWWFWRRSHVTDSMVSELAEAAQSALTDIQAGKDWGDVVTQCYVRMTETASEQRGFKRHSYVTPSEFAKQLERARLPSDSVHRLTTLFERVRYGARNPTQQDIDEAVGCLTSIIQSCQETS